MVILQRTAPPAGHLGSVVGEGVGVGVGVGVGEAGLGVIHTVCEEIS